MNTTNLFVELLVVGVGAFAWTLLLLLGFVGKDINTVMAYANVAWTIPLLSISYVLGIVIDRIADGIFSKFWGKNIRSKFFSSKNHYYKSRSIIFTYSQSISELLEYNRSRLRICRGWALNSIMLVFALNLYALLRPTLYIEQVIFVLPGSILFFIIACGTWYAWRDILIKEYRKTKHQTAYTTEATK